MKTRLIAAALLAGAIILGGCSKDGASGMYGSYTYKISGTVVLLPTQLAGLDAATLAAYKAAGVSTDPVAVGLYPEQGQMHVLDDGDGKVVITFNDLLGNAEIARGTVDGDTIHIDAGMTKAAQLTDGNEKIGAGMVKYSGNGTRYDDTLIIYLTYGGEFKVGDVPMTVVGGEVHCVAQAN